jgi:hypothetical protein
MATKQPLKKKEVGNTSKKSLKEFKINNGYTYNNADKEIEWIVMPKGFQDACRIPGVPCGRVVSVLGNPGTGKSTIINHAITAAQKQGIIPIIIDTENAFSFEYAKSMGFEAEPVYEDIVDDETGEMKNKITHYEGDFFYFNQKILAERYGDIDYATGKTTAKKRKIAVIEDIAQCVNDLLDAQDSGELPFPLLFVWDSVNTIGSFQEYSSGKKANNLWAAGAITTSMREIFDNRIPASRKVSSKYTNTFMYIQKLSVSTAPNGLPVAKGKGGLQLFYSARLQFFLGSISSPGTKVLSAVSKGVQFDYATETKIKITKNQLEAPYNITGEGKFVCTHQGIIGCDEVEEYKKKHLSDLLSRLNQMLAERGEKTISEDELEFKEEEFDD